MPYLSGSLKMFVYAINGFLYTFRNERNLRFHIVTAAFITVLAIITKQPAVEIAILLLTIGAVISLELINTAIERIADTLPDKFDSIRGIVKDIAAGAVLIAAMISLLVGFIIFYDVLETVLTYL